MKGARFEGTSSVRGHRLLLYEDSYPALCADPDGSGTVQGEVYLITEMQLKKLDAFEDVPTLYQRTLVTLSDGRLAFAYLVDSACASRYPALDGPWTGRAKRV